LHFVRSPARKTKPLIRGGAATERLRHRVQELRALLESFDDKNP
jgi:hypothetical protein